MDKEKSETRPPPRLTIREMRFQNFKSYGGIEVVGPFHKSFSSIVGPNGSGKSNVIDGLLFVFGKRAAQIRLKKLSELIHKSDQYKTLTECSVAVHFHEIIDHEDHPDAYDVVPGSEFVITRTANSDNSSQYYINDRKTTFTHVQDFLKGKSVDLDNNRFLILQGEVEQIALMKPKATPTESGLLEYLEDIIGSNKWVEKIEESHKEVEKFNEARQEKLNRVKVVEKEKEALEGPRQEAELFLAKENELHRKQCTVFQRTTMDAEVIVKEDQKKRAQFQEKLDYEQKKQADMADKVASSEEAFRRHKEEHDVVATQMEKAKQDFAAFEREDIQIREDTKFCESEIKKARNKIAKDSKTLKELKDKIEEDTKDIPRHEAQVVQISAKHEKAEAEANTIFESVKGEVEPLRVKMEAKQKELIPLQKKVNECQQQVDVANAELKFFADKTETAAAQLKAAKQSIVDLAADISEKEKQSQENDRTLSHQTKRLAKAKEEFKEAEMQELDLDRERLDLLTKSEGAKSALSQSNERGALLENIMKAKKKNLISGVHGRLGSLGAIDAKYDVAVTTAIPQLDQVLTDNLGCAHKLVQYVRANGWGTVTAISLQNQTDDFSEPMVRPVNPPEGIPRLFDLIRVKDKRYLPAFYAVMRDTLVANDLEQAVRIGYNKDKQWRVVTLKGELVEMTGTMSGGGNQVSRGGMGQAVVDQSGVSAEEAKEIEKKLHDTENRLDKVRVEKKRLEAEIQELQKVCAKATIDAKKLAMAVSSLKTQKEDLESQLQSLEDKLTLSDDDKQRVRVIEKDREKAEASVKAAKKNTEHLEHEIQQYSNEILEAGGSKVKESRARVKKMSDELDRLQGEITKCKVSVQSSEKKIKSLTKEIASAEKELTKTTERHTVLKDDHKKLEKNASNVEAAFKEAQAAVQSKTEQLDKIRKEHDRIKKEVDAIRSVEVDIVNQIEDIDRRIKDNQSKATHWRKKLMSMIETIRKNAALMKPADEDAKAETKESKSDDKGAEATHEDEPKAKKAKPAKKGRKARKDDEKEEDVDDNVVVDTQIPDDLGFKLLTEEELQEVDMEKLKYEITMLETEISQMKPNMRAIAEFRRKEQEYLSKVEQLDKTTQERDNARKIYEGYRKKRLDEFMGGFSQITLRLKEMYQMLTLGGDAELELVDSLDPFSEGIVFSVRPPKKSWKNIVNISGGEKTLSSLALVFALHHFKPTPLYVMDEIDAALDFKNVSIVANYIKERTKNAQFIIISLRNNMFELADRLVGIYKTDNITKSITIDPRKFAVPTVQHPAANVLAASNSAVPAVSSPKPREPGSENVELTQTDGATRQPRPSETPRKSSKISSVR